MSHPFAAPIPPVRVRFESRDAQADAIARAALLVFPARDGSGSVEIFEQHENLGQLVALVETVVRFGIAAGIMQNVFASIAGSPTEGSITRQAPKTDTPPDDLPPHLRGRR